MTADHAEAAQGLFYYWVKENQSDNNSQSYLSDYFERWLKEGKGLEDTSGDFELYLRTVILVIDAWHKDPTVFDTPAKGRWPAILRGPVGIINPDEINNFLNPYEYRWLLNKYLRGKT